MSKKKQSRGPFHLFIDFNNSGLRRFLNDIKDYPVLDNVTQAVLADKAKRGDSIALNTLYECNYRMLVRIARQFCGPGTEMLDLIQEGFIGLSESVSHFDSSLGVSFCNYAGWWIRMCIRRYLQKKPIVHVPEAKFKYYSLLDSIMERTLQEKNRPATAQELHDKTGLNAEVIRTYYTFHYNPDTFQLFDELEDSAAVYDNEFERTDNRISAEIVLSSTEKKDASFLESTFGLTTSAQLSSVSTTSDEDIGAVLYRTRKNLLKKEINDNVIFTMRFVKSSARALRIEVLPIHFRWARKMMLYMIGLLGQIKHELTVSPEKDLITERLMRLFPVFIGKSKAPGNLLELATKDPHVLELLNDNSSESSWSLFGCSSYSKRFFGGEDVKVAEGKSFYESLNYIEQQKKACDMFYESLLSYPDNFLPYRPNDGSVIVTNLSPNIRIPAFCTVYVETSTYLLGLISRISRLTILEGIPQCINADEYKENAQLDFVIPSNGLKKAYDIKENETFTRDDIEPDKIMTALLNGKRTAESLYSITSCVSAETSWVNSISNVPTGIRLQYLNGMAATRALIGGFSTDWADFFCTVAEPVKHDTGSLVDDARLDSEYEPSYPELCDLVLCIKKAIKELEPELRSPSPYAPIILNGSQSDFDSTWNNEALIAELDSENCTEASERDPDAPNEETKSNSALDQDVN